MKKYIKLSIYLAILLSAGIFMGKCSKNEDPPVTADTWDIDKNGVPRFVKVHYVDPQHIGRISRFRSSEGHDYSDGFERCRSMKHYFEPAAGTDWTALSIYAPVSGKITRVEDEWAGTKIEIASDEQPAFRFMIFHIKPDKVFQIGESVAEGSRLGTHIGSQTLSDIAVWVNDPSRSGRLVSWFDVLTVQAFQSYQARGVANRSDFIISKSLRDANPLSCSGDVFTGTDTIQKWVVLK